MTRRVFMCTTVWEHELGETDVVAWAHPEDEHECGDGLVELEVTMVRVVKEPEPRQRGTCNELELTRKLLEWANGQVHAALKYRRKLRESLHRLEREEP